MFIAIIVLTYSGGIGLIRGGLLSSCFTISRMLSSSERWL